jgi:hypothetical protein
MNSTSITLVGICVVATVASLYLPQNHPLNPLTYMNTQVYNNPDILTTEREKDIPLFVYTGTPTTSRKWSSFYDRRHTDARSPLLGMITMTHQEHHKIGPMINIDDTYLLDVLHKIASNSTIEEISGQKGGISLQHNRMLRDSLLYYVVCKNGGILIPNNAILTRPTHVLWEDLMKSPKETVLMYTENSNSEYGCPIIVTRKNNKTSELIATVLFGAGENREFSGGIQFNGGTSVLLERLKRTGLQIHTLQGVVCVNTQLLSSIQPVPHEIQQSSIVLIPFEQGSGTTSIPNRDKWLYSDTPSGLLQNPTVLREIFVLSNTTN